MKLSRFQIPSVVHLPGVSISVQVVNPRNLPKDVDGDWSYGDKGGIIRISSGVGIRRQRYLFYHEMHHAIADIMHTALQDYGKDVAP